MTTIPVFSPLPVSVQQCTACGGTLDERDARTACPSCGGLLEILHPRPLASPEALRAAYGEACCQRPRAMASGVWRFADLVMPSAGEAVVSHPEGNTPLLMRAALDEYTGCRALRVKHEGHNPTGSFKDRGMTVAVTQAKRTGARAVACASTGNTSASLAAYAAQAGLTALVLVPAGQVAAGKMAQSIGYGARTLVVQGDFDDCLRLVREASDELGVYLCNSLNPWRVEGQKTTVLELIAQLGWDAPEWIVLPAGNLGNTSAYGKALREAHALGLIARVPRVVAVQAAGAAPFARGFAEGFVTRHRLRAETVATAIRIGDPASWDRAVRTLRETDGIALAVTDEEILEAKAVIDAAGVGCEPASAASVAGVRALVESGVIAEGERVVAVLTGHMLKDPGLVVRYHVETHPAPARANPPIEIDATIDALARVLG